MKYTIYAVQMFLTLILIIGLVFVFPVYLYAKENVVTVDIIKFKFAPQEITVTPGTTVKWINKEKRQYHSVWFKQLNEEEPEYIFPDESYQRKFDKAGTFPYRCGPHPKMTGTVHVK